MQTNNPTEVELSNLINASLDKRLPIDQQIVDQLDQLSCNLGWDDPKEAIISIFQILDHPTVEVLLSTLEDKIGSLYSRDPKYPIIARIKTCVLFFFTGNGNLKDFHRRLRFHQLEWGEKLGYQKLGNTYDLPAYSTLHEFLNDYLGPVIYDNFDIFVKIVIEIAEMYGLRPGWRSSADSTPHESTANDPEAGYSGHYEINGYKEHRLICVDTKIPLAYKVTKANEYDGNHIQELIEIAEKAKAPIAELWMDQHYTSLENLSYYELESRIKAHYRITKDWKLDESITEDEINRMYQKLWKHDDFLLKDDEECTLEFQLKFIWNNSTTDSHRKAVGRFIRNKAHREYIDTPKQYLAKQGVRSRIEGDFGVIKLFSILKLVTMRKMTSWKALISLRNFIDLIIALFRMDIGQKTNITSWKGIVV